MKKYAIFFTRGFILLLALIPFSSLSQTVLLDSLLSRYNSSNDKQERLTLLRSITAEEPETNQKIVYANELLELARKNNSYFFEHSAELQLGVGYRFMGDLAQSLTHLLASLEIAESNNDETLIGSSLGEIAATYASQGDIKASVQFSDRTIDIFRNRKDTLNLSIALLNTGYDYYTLGEFDASIMYGREAERLVSTFSELTTNRRKSLLAYIRGNMAITQAALGMKTQAVEALNESIENLRSIEDYYAVADFLKFLGEVEFEIGKIDKAEESATEALTLAQTYGLTELNRDLNLLLYRINASKEEFKEALDYHLIYSELADSIENKNVIRQMAKQRSAFELAQKQSEVELLRVQKKNQQAVIVTATVVVFAFAILVIVIFVYYRSKIRVNRVLKRQKVALERLNETKDKFFSIISHDLRGPVSSLFGVSGLIRHFVKEKNNDQLLEMADHMETSVERLSNLLDQLLNWAMQQQGHFPNVPEKVNITEMITEINGMFSNMANGKQVSLSSYISEPILLWVDRNSVHTIFRNLINNAIKFTPEGGSIEVEAKIGNEMVEISVSDSGIGIPQSKLDKLFNLDGEGATYGTAGEKGLGLGLQLVKEFMDMNNGSISAKSNEGEGTTFLVKLPLFDKSEVPDKELVKPIQ
ncbi:tetratricopeptide repeat-containing sensor histidine kinase [Ekhidna sp. To15]|uniref:ATP-binding protein n=1 Tax=Ekhidna sp. To15 TaxID=3395267 RepID=UPI003F51E6DF